MVFLLPSDHVGVHTWEGEGEGEGYCFADVAAKTHFYHDKAGWCKDIDLA